MNETSILVGRPDPGTYRQIQLIHDQLKRSPYVLLVIDLFIAWLIAPLTGWPLIGGWLVVSAAVQAGRMRFVTRLELAAHAPTVRDINQLALWFFANGLTRVLPIFFAFRSEAADLHMMVTLVMVGQAAGGVGTAAGFVRAFVAWSAPVACSLIGGWIWQGAFENYWIALLLVFLFTLLTANVRSYGRAIVQLGIQVQLANAERARAEAERERADEERARAEAAVMARTRFFAAASHDLRQPLGALRWYGDAVLVHANKLKHEPLQTVGAGIIRALEHAEPLVSKYLDIAKMESGALEISIQRCDVPALVQRVRQEYAREFDESGIALTEEVLSAPAECLVQTDINVLRSILDNLVGNALKFTNEGAVTLRIARVEKADAPFVRIAVIDTGVGIAANELDKIFEDFYQLQNPGRSRARGVGLGLSIVKRQAALIGASIAVKSEPGAGSTFWIDLPADKIVASVEPSSAVKTKPAPIHGSIRALLIDDEAEVRAALCAMLTAHGWMVAAAADPAAAETILAEGFTPDVLLVDYRLTGPETGIDVITRWRAHGDCEAPAVLLTGDSSPDRLAEFARVGLPVLHKPIESERLLALVHACLSHEGAA